MRKVLVLVVVLSVLFASVAIAPPLASGQAETEEIVFEIVEVIQHTPFGDFSREPGIQGEVSSDGEYSFKLKVLANRSLPQGRFLWWFDLEGAGIGISVDCGVGDWNGVFNVMAGREVGREIGALSLVVDSSQGVCQLDPWHKEISSWPTAYLSEDMFIWLEVRPYPYGYAKVWIRTPEEIKFCYRRETTPTPTATPTFTPTPTSTLKPTWTPRPTVVPPTLVPVWYHVYLPLLSK